MPWEEFLSSSCVSVPYSIYLKMGESMTFSLICITYASLSGYMKFSRMCSLGLLLLVRVFSQQTGFGAYSLSVAVVSKSHRKHWLKEVLKSSMFPLKANTEFWIRLANLDDSSFSAEGISIKSYIWAISYCPSLIMLIHNMGSIGLHYLMLMGVSYRYILCTTFIYDSMI